MAKAAWVFALLLASAWPIHADPTDWQHASYIVDSFFEIALKNEFSRNGQIVRKWPTSGIRYHYVHRVQDSQLHEKLAELHLQHLQSITVLTIALSPAKQANLTIVFSSEDSLKDDLRQFFGIKSATVRDNFFRHSVCIAHFSTNDNGNIDNAAVIIPVDRARDHGKLVDCIVEELTQVMGLPNDSEKVFPSIFNDRSIDHMLSGLDFVLLKILYDSRLNPGLNKAQAEAIVRIIVQGFFANGLIAEADRTVQIGGLFKLDGN